MVVLEGREGCQNDPREMLNNPPGGMRPEDFSFLRKSRLYNGFYTLCFPLVFLAQNKLLFTMFCQKVALVFVKTSGYTNVDNMGIDIQTPYIREHIYPT